MITSNARTPADAVPGQAVAFESAAGIAALLAGAAGFLYAVAFIILKNAGLSALLLMLTGLFSLVALVALYSRVRWVDESAALVGLVFGMAGALGALVHGGYDLANALHPPSSVPALPSAVDPRGLLTFGAAGLALALFAWLIGRASGFPAGLSPLGYLAALLLIVLYLARLVVLDATNPAVVVPAILGGFVVNPAWYGWLGLVFLRQSSDTGRERA
jgi:hypothetical protein